MKKNQRIAIVCFTLIMIALGASDSLRGIFTDAFQTQFQLTNASLAFIMSASYLGNLLFLSLGGRLLDRFQRKIILLLVIFIWMAALLANIYCRSYGMLLVSVAVTMGASTLLNTTVSLLTAELFEEGSAMMVSLLFFVQGIGTSGSQVLLGQYAGQFTVFRYVNGGLLLLALAAGGLFCWLKVPDGEKGESEGLEGQHDVTVKFSTGFLAVCMFGMYFIAEHGILNWMMLYQTRAFSIEASLAARYLALFWGGMTVGRLLFAPLVKLLGVKKSIAIFGLCGGLLLLCGVLGGSKGLPLLSVSGLFLSILYPAMLVLLQQLYPQRILATVVGNVISLATLADIAFNLGFGKVAETVGYQKGFFILPCCFILFYLSFILISKNKKQKMQ